MNRKFIVVVAGLMLVLMFAVTSHAGGVFVATAKNFRERCIRASVRRLAMQARWQS